MSNNRELLELIGSLCDGELGPSQRSRLDQLLDGDPQAQDVYRHYMAMHAELFWQQGVRGDLNDVQPSALPTIDAPSTAFQIPQAVWTLALAGCLVLGALFGFFGRSVGIGEQLPARVHNAKYTPSSSAVAKVTGSRNCLWENDPAFDSVGFGSPLYSGQRIRLTEGLAELTFVGGARIILDAPAELSVNTSSSAELLEGRLTASIPDGSEGFQVYLKGLTLVDHGAEFGVMTDKTGAAEVHVFDGVLEGRFRDKRGVMEREVMWPSESAVRIDSYSHQIKELAKPELVFVRTMAPPSGPSQGLLVKEDFDYPPAQTLADQNGGFGWGGAWENISTDGNLARINRVGSGSLNYVGLSNSGNRATLEGNFNRIRRVLSTSFGGVFDSAGLIENQDGARLVGKDNTTVYISFTQQVSETDEVFYGFELHRGDGNKNRVLCVGHAAAEKWTDGPPRSPLKEAGVTGWSITSEFNGDPNRLLRLGDLGDETTEIVLMVIKITFGADNKDKVEVYKNPQSLIDESQCEPIVVGSGNFSFDRVSLANFEGDKTFSVDHIRFGTNFPAVTRHQWDSNSLAKVTMRIPAGE